MFPVPLVWGVIFFFPCTLVWMHNSTLVDEGRKRKTLTSSRDTNEGTHRIGEAWGCSICDTGSVLRQGGSWRHGANVKIILVGTADGMEKREKKKKKTQGSKSIGLGFPSVARSRAKNIATRPAISFLLSSIFNIAYIKEYTTGICSRGIMGIW